MIEVLREGEPTLDGRFINHGAIELPEDAVPLFDVDADAGKDEYASIGELYNFRRSDDGRIYCDTDVEDERTITLTVAIDEREYVAGEEIGVAHGRIIGGVIGAELKYPWKQDN
jgi:hypothetical protein